MLLRAILAFVLPNAKLFRLSLLGARLARPFAGLMPGSKLILRIKDIRQSHE